MEILHAIEYSEMSDIQYQQLCTGLNNNIHKTLSWVRLK